MHELRLRGKKVRKGDDFAELSLSGCEGVWEWVFGAWYCVVETIYVVVTEQQNYTYDAYVHSETENTLDPLRATQYDDEDLILRSK